MNIKVEIGLALGFPMVLGCALLTIPVPAPPVDIALSCLLVYLHAKGKEG